MIVANVYSCSEAMLAGEIHDLLEDRMAAGWFKSQLFRNKLILQCLMTKMKVSFELERGLFQASSERPFCPASWRIRKNIEGPLPG